MILHKTEQNEDRLSLRRGAQGQTVQSIEAVRDREHVRLTIRRIGKETATVEFDPAEVESLRAWLMLVPQVEEQS